MIKLILISIILALAVVCQDPPLLPSDSFQIAYDQTYIQTPHKYQVNGQMYYDSKNNRQRVDRTNGQYNLFCGGILPNVTTACTHLTTGNKRYIIFPQRKQCCFCCDSQHGCGILKRNWLEGAKFLGPERLVDTNYNKWSKDGDFGYNYFWTTIDNNNIPRRLDQNGAHITDYLTHTFVNKTFDDSYFAVPSYCTDPCPSTTICGKLRGEQREKETMLTYED